MQTTPTLPPMTPPRPQPQEPYASDPEQQRREQAIKRIQDKNAFTAHLAAYLVINVLFIVIWAITGSGYFWPIYFMLG